jgi:hypothetical protein
MTHVLTRIQPTTPGYEIQCSCTEKFTGLTTEEAYGALFGHIDKGSN